MTNSLIKSFNLKNVRTAQDFTSKNVYGFFLCVRGRAHVSLGKKQYHITVNDLCLYIPYGELTIHEASDDFLAIIIEETQDIFYRPIAALPLEYRIRLRQNPCVRLGEEQRTRIDEVVRLITDRAGFYKEIAIDSNRKFIQEALISIVTFGCFDVLNVFFESKPIDSLPRTHNETIYDRFISSLLLNYPSKRTVAFYADEQHLSPAYFSVVIKEVSGKSVMQWIVDVTIMRAKQLLTGSQLSMKDIANEFNFQDQSSFGRYFKHYVGVSPLRYRSAHKVKGTL